MKVRVAGEADLPLLVATMGQERFFADRLERQGRGLGELFVAWSGALPVGDVYLWREENYEQLVRDHLDGTPTITHLEVDPGWQNRGIGTALVRAAERHAAQLGYAQVGLGVGVDNPEARRLYERLGYAEWAHGLVEVTWDEAGPDGVLVDHALTCHWMVHRLGESD